MSDVNLFRECPVFSSFNDLTEPSRFRPLPGDWWVIVADIEGSTQAIEAGRYKDVNMLGASCIVAAQNAMGGAEFPYVFGGDGTTLLIPEDYLDAVSAALAGVRRMARTAYDMRLRVGAIAIADLGPDGGTVEVARYCERDMLRIARSEIFNQRFTAMIRGGGISAAERRIKTDPARYEVPDADTGEEDLSGLSCRWKPVPSLKGRMLSLLVAARAGDVRRATRTYDEVLHRLDEILDGDIATANPIHVSEMGYKSVIQLLWEERKLYRSWLSKAFLKNAIEIVYAVAVFKYHVPAVFFDATRYAAAIDTHSDFRKFDDLLRMVIDCSTAQADEIRAYLESLAAAGEVFFGLHLAPEALMTCFVYGMGDGEHIHFVWQSRLWSSSISPARSSAVTSLPPPSQEMS